MKPYVRNLLLAAAVLLVIGGVVAAVYLIHKHVTSSGNNVSNIAVEYLNELGSASPYGSWIVSWDAPTNVGSGTLMYNVSVDDATIGNNIFLQSGVTGTSVSFPASISSPLNTSDDITVTVTAYTGDPSNAAPPVTVPFTPPENFPPILGDTVSFVNTNPQQPYILWSIPMPSSQSVYWSGGAGAYNVFVNNVGNGAPTNVSGSAITLQGDTINVEIPVTQAEINAAKGYLSYNFAIQCPTCSDAHSSGTLDIGPVAPGPVTNVSAGFSF